MATRLASEKTASAEIAVANLPLRRGLHVALHTGGFDRPYAFGLSMSLVSRGLWLDVIGSDEVDSPEMHATPRLNFLNLQGGKRPDAGLAERVLRVLSFYTRLCRYSASAKPRIFHILWNNKLAYIDRTILMLYYKFVLRKRVVLTAHNVNTAKRDDQDSLLNRVTLRVQYSLADHIFVHTDKMKAELLRDFGISEQTVSVIPFGINNSVPNTDLTPLEAKQRLGLSAGEKAILFFGAIRPYKGLESLVAAFGQLAPKHADYRLVIAGERKKGSEKYLDDILQLIGHQPWRDRVIQRIEFVPDEETELYFKAADVLALPYAEVFQSGVLFLSYSFGLPAIATDVGSFRDEIIDGQTGFVCRAHDSRDLATAIETYFASELYGSLEQRRAGIRKAANLQNSWDTVAERTCQVYAELLTTKPD
jgi:glycosyltransferase involved in cell wall biosynthesis